MKKEDNIFICAFVGIIVVALTIAFLCVTKGQGEFVPDTPPEGWNCVRGDALTVRRIGESGTLAVGNDLFLLTASSQGVVDLYSFSASSDLSDYSHFLTYLYSDYLSERVACDTGLALEDVALCKTVVLGQLNYVQQLCAYALSGALGANEHATQANRLTGVSPVNFDFCSTARYEKNMDRLLNYCGDKTVMAYTAYRFGKYFSGYDKAMLQYMLYKIESDEKFDLLKSRESWIGNFDFSLSEECARDWRELHKVAYFEVLSSLKRVNKELSDSLSRLSDKKNYRYAHDMIERVRPVMRNTARRYSYVFCDLPVLVVTSEANFETHDADPRFWFTDKNRVKRVAYSLTRTIADGKMTDYLRSHTATDAFVTYHAYLRKVLGENDYKSFKTAIELARHEELKVDGLRPARDDFGD